MPYPPNLSLPIEKLLSTAVHPQEFQFDPAFTNDPEVQKLAAQQKENEKIKNIFKGFTFCLGRETPRYSLEMIIRSCGGKIDDENSNDVTHQIVDRPVAGMSETREYLQPQWVYDSLNFAILLPLAQYRPNITLPPHLSPFVDYKNEGYVPDRFKEILNFKGENFVESKKIEKERKQLGKIMMTRKIRGLYNKMKGSAKKKKDMVEKLKRRKEGEEKC
jgi:pescadillo protein